MLADVASRTNDPDDHEHVSLYIYRHPEIYSLKNLAGAAELTRPDLALTLDTREDFDLLHGIFEALYPTNPTFDLADILHLIDTDPALAQINAHVRRKHV